MKSDFRNSQEDYGILGESVEMKKIIEVIEQVGPSDITVLISGESGVGSHQGFNVAGRRTLTAAGRVARERFHRHWRKGLRGHRSGVHDYWPGVAWHRLDP